MIKLVCISKNLGKRYFLYITLGKIYEGNLWYGDYHIIDDDNVKAAYPQENFITLAEWRDKQINSILDD